jgi:trehalose/maltose transport system permease protein
MSGDRDQLSRSRTRTAWLFLAPMLVVLALVAAWPLLRTIWLGLTDANLLRMGQAKWVGFENFAGKHGLLHDKVWWHAVKNTLWFTLLTVSIETVLGMVIALVLTRTFPGRADRGLGQDVELDAERPVRHHQSHPARARRHR